MRNGWLTLVAALWLTSSASGRDIFVNNVAGDDLFSGASASPLGMDGPVRTIARALELAQARDRIVLANTGVAYREMVSLSAGRHSGTRQEPFVLDGNGAVLDGSRPIDPRLWSPVRGQQDVFRFQPPRMVYQQIFLDGKPLPRVVPEGETSPVPALQPLQWCLWQGHVYLRIEQGKWIDDYALSHTYLTTGITLYHVRHTVVVDVIVQGFQLDGVNAHDASDCTLHAITARGNGRAGITVAGASRVTIDSCLVGDNGAAQLWTEGYSHTDVIMSQLLPATAPAVLRHGGELQMEQPSEPVP